MEEKVVLQEGDVLVSTTRVVVSGITYQLSDITSVRKTMKREDNSTGLFLSILSGVIGLGLLVGVKDLIAKLIGMALLLGGGFAAWNLQKPTTIYYALTFTTSEGEVRAQRSKEEAPIDRIVDAINKALAERG